MEKTIYNVIEDIDKYIKKNRLYMDIRIHNFGKFNFQSIYSAQYDKYQPYHVKSDDIAKSFNDIGYEYKSRAYGGLVKLPKDDYYLMSDYAATDFFKNTFLQSGIYFSTGFISDKGHIVVATYSKNFKPAIYESNFLMNKNEGTQPLLLSNLINPRVPYVFKPDKDEECTLSFNMDTSSQKESKLKKFFIANPHLNFTRSSSVEKMKIQIKSEYNFNWSDVFNSINKIATDYFNDSDINILNRADLVSYLVKNSLNLEKEILSVGKEEKIKILDFFRSKQDFMVLLPQSIDLSQNNFYKIFDIEKSYDQDYGAQKINKMCSFINLQLSLDSQTTKTTRVKI